MNFKLSTLVAASLLTCASGLTMAAESDVSFSGTAAMTTDYRYRGISQTENDPAVQVGFALAHASGVYGGVWGSNVGFANSLELDPYLGYSTELSSLASKPTLDVGVWYYGYPSSSDLNWAEYYARLTFGSVFMADDSLYTNINYANDFLGDLSEGDQWYLNAVYSFPIANTGFGGVASLGYTTTSETDFNGATAEVEDDYIDWKVGATYGFKSVEGLTAELAAVGTNIDTDGQTDVAKRTVETGAVFTITKAF